MVNNWKSLKNSRPLTNELVQFSYIVTGAGGNREGWETVGRIRESGIFSLKQNVKGGVSFIKPTHWKPIDEEKTN